MNNDIFQLARQAYQDKDYERALSSFTECLEQDPDSLQPGEVGMLYHQIGNCLVKLKDYNEAIHAYTQATSDAAYAQAGAVNYNLGNAYAALHDYEDAVRHFEIASSDAKYDAKYRAYIGMGNAYLKLGKSAEAGAAFRSAALDESNPDPTKALLNLGICFMALNRPNDAVTSYENALQFDMPAATRNKLCANLGQAYVASGQMQKAVSAFEQALADDLHELEFEGDVVFAVLPAVALVDAVGAVDDKHLVARPLHKQTFGRGVDALKGIGGRVAVVARADEGAGVVHGQFGEHAGARGAQIGDDHAIALVDVGIAAVGGDSHGAEEVVKLLVDLDLVEAGKELVGRVALFEQVFDGDVCGGCHGDCPFREAESVTAIR